MDFSDISPLPAVLQTVASNQSFSNGQTLFHRNDLSQFVYVVKIGQVRLLFYTRSGQAISHYTVNKGEICDEGSIFRRAYTCSAIAEASTQAVVFPKQVFLDALRQDPGFAFAFMTQLSHRLHTTKTMVELRSIRSAQERVLHYLHLIVPPEKDTVVLEQPLKNIASDLGITPEVLSRTLTKLVNEGAIVREKRQIKLLQSSA